MQSIRNRWQRRTSMRKLLQQQEAALGKSSSIHLIFPVSKAHGGIVCWKILIQPSFHFVRHF
jgi:hypothetical protein